MNHVHVVTTNSHFEYDRLRLTKNALISLEKTLQYSLNTPKGAGIHKNADLIREYKERVIGTVPGSKLYLDSGGYSIIKGDVPFDRILSFIDEYHDFVSKNVDLFDYVFSLDIPIGFYKENEKEKKLHEYDTIYNLNKISMQKTLEMIKRRPEIKEKFYFIQHFKMLDQFEIWNQLEEELNINDHIIHRSIGGLVGLKKMVRHFQRTTFLPMIFKSFFNFIEVYKKDHEEPYLGGFEQVFDKFSWRQPLKDLFNAVDKLTSYSDLKLLKRFAECEGLINGSGLKSLVKDSSLDHLTEKLKEILDIYFDQLQSSPQTNKNQLFEHIIDKVLGEDSSDRKKDQIDAFASEKREFRLHVLGVSNMQDRYMITLVEKLLNNHCLNEGLKVEINITYDSIFYTTQAQKNFRNLNYFRRDGTKRTLTEIDEEDLKLVYPDKYELVKQEIKSDRLLDADTFTPLNINSNILIDQYFKEMMDERSLPSSLVKTLDKYYEGRKVVEELGEILDGEAQFLLSLAENPAEVVMNKKRLAEKLNDDLCTIVHFYLLIKRKEGLNAINAAVKDHINAIDYPFQLK